MVRSTYSAIVLKYEPQIRFWDNWIVYMIVQLYISMSSQELKTSSSSAHSKGSKSLTIIHFMIFKTCNAEPLKGAQLVSVLSS